ncbi:MAG: site-specific DNA-methyltransferase [Planctomycetes bacterium]|nr:site-specific DNA-methyltransferase [Planctomycetota bacterium]
MPLSAPRRRRPRAGAAAGAAAAPQPPRGGGRVSRTVHHAECLEFMRSMDANSVDAIVTDPPYFKVKGEAWDRQWDKPTQFLAWLDKVAEQWQRVLRPNGSLYCFASWRMAARVECLIAERFDVLSHVVWQKGDQNGNGMHTRQHKEDCRAWFPQTERIVFAEHRGSDNIAKGEAGYAAKCDELRGFVFEPLRAYLAGERDRAGFTTRAVAEEFQKRTGSRTVTGMAGHWFERVQWTLPTRENYEWLRELFHLRGNWEENTKAGFLRREYEDLRREYEDLRREYEDLRREYEDLRRPFSVTADVPYTDVWTFPTVQHYKGKHPCEKPLAMMEHIIRTSTRPGAVVLDCFAGSGVTGEACRNLDRQFIGIEQDAKWAAIAADRVANARQPAQLWEAVA